jgi:hypothetical protein
MSEPYIFNYNFITGDNVSIVSKDTVSSLNKLDVLCSELPYSESLGYVNPVVNITCWITSFRYNGINYTPGDLNAGLLI